MDADRNCSGVRVRVHGRHDEQVLGTQQTVADRDAGLGRQLGLPIHAQLQRLGGTCLERL
jgi:hypothetical protein